MYIDTLQKEAFFALPRGLGEERQNARQDPASPTRDQTSLALWPSLAPQGARGGSILTVWFRRTFRRAPPRHVPGWKMDSHAARIQWLPHTGHCRGSRPV